MVTIRLQTSDTRVPIAIDFGDSTLTVQNPPQLDPRCTAVKLTCVSATVTAAPNAVEGPRDVKLTFPANQGKPQTIQTISKGFFVERKRVVVLAVDGFGWDAFQQVVSDQGNQIGALFAAPPMKGQSLQAEARATFTPITFGRWTTIFSGALPKDHKVPSNKFFNRSEKIAEATLGTSGAEQLFGAADQCMTCGDASQGAFVQLAWWFGKKQPYNRHFQVPFIYDKLRSPQTRSVVVLQQAGLGQGNGAAGSGQDTWHNFPLGLLNAAGMDPESAGRSASMTRPSRSPSRDCEPQL